MLICDMSCEVWGGEDDSLADAHVSENSNSNLLLPCNTWLMEKYYQT